MTDATFWEGSAYDSEVPEITPSLSRFRVVLCILVFLFMYCCFSAFVLSQDVVNIYATFSLNVALVSVISFVNIKKQI